MSVSNFKLLIILFVIFRSILIFPQRNADSLVIFSDLKFHSEFEKEEFTKYTTQKLDTFMFFMAIDEKMTDVQAIDYYQSYNSIFEILNKDKLGKKKNKKDIERIFELIHDRLFEKYSETDYFPQIFTKSTYNCLTASILYSLVYGRLQIPYKIYQTPNHVYMVMQPGDNSIILETTNPNIKKEIYDQDYKEEYVQKLKSVKIVSENESLSKSLDEIFHEKYYKSLEADFDNLFGFQYLNKGLSKLKENDISTAYELFQKAYFFFPDPQLKRVLYSSLMQNIEKCEFNKIEDIDYLVNLLRYSDVNVDKISDLFIEIIKYQIQFTDKGEFCDSLLNRFVGQINEKKTKDQLSFNYYLFLGKSFRNSDKMTPYIEKAVEIKQNHIEANNLFIEQIERRLDRIVGSNVATDSIDFMEKEYNYQFVKPILADYRLIATLNQAYNFFCYNKIDEGVYFLKQFEAVCPYPIEPERKKLIRAIETTYRSLAIYYAFRHQKQMAQKIVDMGLKYVPGSRYIQTAIY
jgi:hypothetical protein